MFQHSQSIQTGECGGPMEGLWKLRHWTSLAKSASREKIKTHAFSCGWIANIHSSKNIRNVLVKGRMRTLPSLKPGFWKAKAFQFHGFKSRTCHRQHREVQGPQRDIFTTCTLFSRRLWTLTRSRYSPSLMLLKIEHSLWPEHVLMKSALW